MRAKVRRQRNRPPVREEARRAAASEKGRADVGVSQPPPDAACECGKLAKDHQYGLGRDISGGACSGFRHADASAAWVLPQNLADAPPFAPDALRCISLFTGGGGLDRGVEQALPSARVFAMVEREAYAAGVLVQAIEEGRLAPALVHTNIRTFDGQRFRGLVDCVYGGWPCQPSSVAGARKGTADERWLWPEVARVLDETDAPIFFGENVPGQVSVNGGQALGEVFSDLADLGFDVEDVAAGMLSAADVGAPHIRRRFFLLAVRGRGRALLADALGRALRDESGRRGRPHGESAPVVGYARQHADVGELADATRSSGPCVAAIDGAGRPQPLERPGAWANGGVGDGRAPARVQERARVDAAGGARLRFGEDVADAARLTEREPRDASVRVTNGRTESLGGGCATDLADADGAGFNRFGSRRVPDPQPQRRNNSDGRGGSPSGRSLGNAARFGRREGRAEQQGRFGVAAPLGAGRPIAGFVAHAERPEWGAETFGRRGAGEGTDGGRREASSRFGERDSDLADAARGGAPAVQQPRFARGALTPHQVVADTHRRNGNGVHVRQQQGYVAPVASGRGARSTPVEETAPWPPGPDDADGWWEYLAAYPELAPAVPQVPRGGGTRREGSESGVRDGVDGLADGVEPPVRMPDEDTEPDPRDNRTAIIDGAEICLHDRLDRLRLLGNGVVPQCAAAALRALARQILDVASELPVSGLRQRRLF